MPRRSPGLLLRIARLVLLKLAKRLPSPVYAYISHNLPHMVTQYLWVAIGSMISGVSINIFFVPHHLLSGGVSGVAMIIFFLFHYPLGLLTTLLNIPIFYLAYKMLNKEYVFGAFYGMIIFSASLDATRFLADINFIDDILLASIYGGILTGIGSGIIFRVNGSSGGTDIIGAIMKKYYGYSMGSMGFAINCVVMIFAGVFFGPKSAMYTLFAMYAGAVLTDKIVEGFNRKKSIMIISDKHEEISVAILNELGRGITILKGEGAFTHQEKKVLYIVVTFTQIAKIKIMVEDIDTSAFLIIQDAAEVSGKGFTH
ncbi:uncharacterized membrane-anchored protein YitT (DUF2179 family) [Sporomusaceae bacterium BoRhaA]|uniref:YitT family protein n=1 Tax=Pelorhabdus rhamnosifermentans TaxID=2772457 RepID=UPI001FE6A43D|nr:YitT family protein [Pelorhabdus rhamnosifermentans]MBU2702118.1 uncharacterized membrane-anchored protein YitT (DUF2179 family) [Pelorhabdus rhamnosifermentans]